MPKLNKKQITKTQGHVIDIIEKYVPKHVISAVENQFDKLYTTSRVTKSELEKLLEEANLSWIGYHTRRALIKQKEKGLPHPCERPGCILNNQPFQVHHFFSRTHLATKFDISNGIYLHEWCHLRWADKNHEICRDIIIELYGEEELERMRKIYRVPKKWGVQELTAHIEMLDCGYPKSELLIQRHHVPFDVWERLGRAKEV